MRTGWSISELRDEDGELRVCDYWIEAQRRDEAEASEPPVAP